MTVNIVSLLSHNFSRCVFYSSDDKAAKGSKGSKSSGKGKPTKGPYNEFCNGTSWILNIKMDDLSFSLTYSFWLSLFSTAQKDEKGSKNGSMKAKKGERTTLPFNSLMSCKILSYKLTH